MKILLIFFGIVFFLGKISAQEPEINLPPGSAYNFIVIGCHGRMGYRNQQEVADAMANVATESGVRFIVTAGDNFQRNGVQSIHDPLWMTCFENVYTHPSLHRNWFPALGNHDHYGCTQSMIDYSKVSRRWKMPNNYYTVVKSRRGVTIRLVIIDTYYIISAFSGSYWNSSSVEFTGIKAEYNIENAKRQLEWVDSVLTVAAEDWVVVVGHHPVFSARRPSKELIEHLNPILNRHDVDFYVCSHDHIFQHMRDPDSNIDYIMTTAGSAVRQPASNDMTIFTTSEPTPGFSVGSATKTDFSMYFVDIDGKAIYHYTREK